MSRPHLLTAVSPEMSGYWFAPISVSALFEPIEIITPPTPNHIAQLLGKPYDLVVLDPLEIMSNEESPLEHSDTPLHLFGYQVIASLISLEQLDANRLLIFTPDNAADRMPKANLSLPETIVYQWGVEDDDRILFQLILAHLNLTDES